MPLILPIWTLLIWATRIRNILSQHGHATDVVVPGVLTVLALVALADRRRGVPVLAGVTIAVWAVRLPLVLVHHHDVPFKAVHTVLAVVSVGLAVLSWRGISRRRAVALAGGDHPRSAPSTLPRHG